MRISSRFSLLIAMACIAGSAMAVGSDAPTSTQPVPVAASEGVSRSQAILIAERYFGSHVGCGGFDGVTELPDAWKVEGKFGYAGTPVEGFFIDKKTGALTLPALWRP
jgi:hypothetical protein